MRNSCRVERILNVLYKYYVLFLALKTGKHMFEIHWPRKMRHTMATVGVGTEIAPLFVKPKASLVGCNKYSWGLDISRYKCLHRDNIIANLPKNKLVPDTYVCLL